MAARPDLAPGVGLDAPIPEDWPGGGHRIRKGMELRRWPSVYLTPRVRRVIALHSHEARRRHVRTDGVIHWPAPLARALAAIDDERALVTHG